jgi:hypothetical protein
MEHEPTSIEQSDINANNETKNIMKQSQINEYTTQPSSGRGAKKYRKPSIEWIPLDNDISLALESTPPGGPGEVYNATTPTHLITDPYKFTNS